MSFEQGKPTGVIRITAGRQPTGLENSPLLQRTLAVVAVLFALGTLALVAAIILLRLDPNFWWAVIGGVVAVFSAFGRMD